MSPGLSHQQGDGDPKDFMLPTSITAWGAECLSMQ